METVPNVNDQTNPLNYVPYYDNTNYTINKGFRTAITSISGYPVDNTTSTNDYTALLNGNSRKIGPSKVVKKECSQSMRL